MKSPLFLLVVLGLASPTANVRAAAYTTGFDPALFSTGEDLAGQDGWMINDPTPHSSFFVDLNRSVAGALGGYYDPPASSSVDLTHAYGGSLSGSSFSVDFALIPSTELAPGSDSFGYSFNGDSNNSLLRMAFEPNPVKPMQDASLEIVYYDSSNTRTSTQFDLFYGAIYKLAISFGTSGADATFNAQLSAGIGAPLLWTGTLVGAGAAMLASFGVDFDVNGATGADSGDNFMIFDDLSVTGPSPPAAPPTPNIALNASGQPVISFQGIPGTAYQLLRSTTLLSSSWSAQETRTASASGAVEFVDLTPPVDRAFYQVALAPPVVVP